VTQKTEECNRMSMEEKSNTSLLNIELSRKQQAEMEASKKAEMEAQKIMVELKASIDDINLAITKKVHSESNEYNKEQLNILTESFERKFKAIQPDLIAALEASGNKGLATALAEHIPQAGGGIGMILGKQLLDNIIGMVKGTSMESALNSIAKGNK
jgi:hypothetical protein